LTIDCVILDFDGTLTNVHAEAQHFTDGYQESLREQLGRDISQEWEAAEAVIRQDPDLHGWEWNGQIVAPWHADPYISCAATAKVILDKSGELPDLNERREILTSFFNKLYGENIPAWKPETKEFLAKLLEKKSIVYVVTNSQPDAVFKKLCHLDPERAPKLKLRGNARKFVLAPTSQPYPEFEALPETRAIAGLKRPICLKRGHYFETLYKLREELRMSADNILICGDIFEMDLAMPGELGFHIHLVPGKTTREFERNGVLSYPTGTLAESLLDVLNIV
jgi:beta-phosphoglucomutase-like phosphatase (HAD superfamily)